VHGNPALGGLDDKTLESLSPELRRKNVRTAWLLAAFAAFMALSSIPFWLGLFNMIQNGQ
jgi:hypothetical protein